MLDLEDKNIAVLLGTFLLRRITQFSYLRTLPFVCVLFSHSQLRVSHSRDGMWTTKQIGGGCRELLSVVWAVWVCGPRVCLCFTHQWYLKWDRVWRNMCVCVCFTVVPCLLCTSVSFYLIITVCVCMGNHDCVARGYHRCYLLFCVCIYSMCLCTSSWVKRVILNLGLIFLPF